MTRTPRLLGVVGPGFTIRVTNSAGRRIAKVKAGTYLLAVRDRSRIHNFHLVGPGVNKRTGVSFQGTTTWRLRLKKRAVYRFRCDPHPSMKGSFRVT